jgi:hypothetical protein
MSGTPRAGRNARIKIDTSSGGATAAVTVSSKNKWTLDQSVDTFEVTAFEDVSRSYVVGLPDAKGTIEGFWDSADSNVYNLIGSSVARQLYIYPDVSNNATTYFFTTAFFSVKADGDTKSAVNFSLNFAAATPGTWVHP